MCTTMRSFAQHSVSRFAVISLLFFRLPYGIYRANDETSGHWSMHNESDTPTHKSEPLTGSRALHHDETGVVTGLMRILVVDSNPAILSDIENALWVWPHKVTLALDVKEAESLCRHLTPTAILAAANGDSHNDTVTISALRACLPRVPLIALVSAEQAKTPGRFIERGADALLPREDAGHPTLHDLVMSVQPKSSGEITPRPLPGPQLPFSLRQSEMLGALICDVAGLIVDSNLCLARSLGYRDTKGLTGQNVSSDLLGNRGLWVAWKQVAGDTKAILRRRSEIAGVNGQRVWMQVEVVAAPRCPNYLQAVFVDRTELVMVPSESMTMAG